MYKVLCPNCQAQYLRRMDHKNKEYIWCGSCGYGEKPVLDQKEELEILARIFQ